MSLGDPKADCQMAAGPIDPARPIDSGMGAGQRRFALNELNSWALCSLTGA
jgi:hypothetical protein